jgi:GNAT superfamily N-acetyltransferase
MLTLRTALPHDAQQIAALHAASWRYAYRGALSDEYLARDIVSECAALWSSRLESPSPAQLVIVAEVDNDTVGFACAYANADIQWGTLLDNMHVAQGLQGKGIGTSLIGAIAQWCTLTISHKGLFLWVLQSNVRAQRFYQGLGAVNTGTDVWAPPGGGAVPRCRYAWLNVWLLSQNAHAERLLAEPRDFP